MSAKETTFGRIGTVPASKGEKEHRLYEFRVPLRELPAAVEGNLELGFMITM